MTFTKQQIAEFKSQRRSYMTYRKRLTPSNVKECFYNSSDNITIESLFPDKDIQYCHCDMYDIVIGDYKRGIRYVNEKGTFYLFWSANSFWANPQSIAVGKAEEGKIYLIMEHFPDHAFTLNFREIPEEYVNRLERGFRPKSYNHTIMITRSDLSKATEKITDEDVKCLNIAYEGVRAFSKLIAKVQ